MFEYIITSSSIIIIFVEADIENGQQTSGMENR